MGNQWNLEERVEDAIVAYLVAQKTIAGVLKVYTAFTDDGIEYPSAIVIADETRPVDENAVTDPARAVSVSIAVATESAPLLNAQGQVIKTSRQRNAEARNAVLGALMVDDLREQLQAKAVGVSFSEVDVSRTARTVEPELRKMATMIDLTVIAQPMVT